MHWQETVGRTLHQIRMHDCMKNGSVVLVDIRSPLAHLICINCIDIKQEVH